MTNKQVEKICMIIPYFGSWPEWFPLYLYSCSTLDNIDFYFFSDCGTPNTTYKNTVFINIGFVDYCNMVTDKLKVEFHPEKPYKLTDLKPFLGTVHSDIVNKYAFWGFSDIDLLYGDIENMINQKILKKYDFITTHSDRIAGHFTVIRTGSVYSTAWEKIPDWRRMLSCQKHYGIDERWLTYAVLPAKKWLDRGVKYLMPWIKPRTETFYRAYDFMQGFMRIIYPKILFKEQFTTVVPAKEQIWIYDAHRRTILDAKTGKTIPYLHFLFFKKTPYLETENYWKSGFYKISKGHTFSKNDRFDISLEGIVPSNQS